ncbi:low molecular weight phosphotyrosine protein phosphatase, partial [Burkholderia pseudomallei]
GVDAAPHRWRRLSRALVRAADLVLVTVGRLITEFVEIDPFARGKVDLLGKWDDAEFCDPHGGPVAVYREIYTVIVRLVKGWLLKLC